MGDVDRIVGSGGPARQHPGHLGRQFYRGFAGDFPGRRGDVRVGGLSPIAGVTEVPACAVAASAVPASAMVMMKPTAERAGISEIADDL